MKKKINKKIDKREKKKATGGAAELYDYHLSVFLEKSVAELITDKNGAYVDGTLGGGGHAATILANLDSGGNLYAFDKDINAIKHCRFLFEEEFKKTPPRLVLIEKCFSELSSIAFLQNGFDGLLLDLGVSSKQLDTEQVGLSYRVNSNLDMRFGSEGTSAYEIINTASEDEIAYILKTYGEEPFAKLIAKRIAERRRFSPLQTTFDLRTIIEHNIAKQYHFKTLSRVFQAIRIAVNKELEVLSKTLEIALPLLNIGGRMVIISYHSLEDRIVKNFFKEHSLKKRDNDISITLPKLKIITPKPIIPDENEIIRNPRSRSAKMRIAERET